MSGEVTHAGHEEADLASVLLAPASIMVLRAVGWLWWGEAAVFVALQPDRRRPIGDVGPHHLFGEDVTAMAQHRRAALSMARTYQITNRSPPSPSSERVAGRPGPDAGKVRARDGAGATGPPPSSPG
jgi:hypothetical protein